MAEEMLGFHSLHDEVATELPVEGELPSWLSGSLIRNGPGAFSFEDAAVEHWFDGLAMLQKYTFNGGGVAYRNRLLRTEAYEAAREGTFEGGFATAETTLRERLTAFLGPPYDNTNVIAGKDDLDPRQGDVPTENYLDALSDSDDPTDVTVGVVEEGFGHEVSDPAVDETVRDAVSSFEDAGAEVTEVSIPMHLDGLLLWNAIALEGTAATVDSEGVGHYGKGFYDTQMADAFGRARRAQADDYVTTLKLTLVLGQYLSDEYRGHYYAKAQNLSRKLTEKYTEALADIDVLAMPTTPQTAHEVDEDISRVEAIDRALNMLNNTAPFDVTGHPATSVPAGTANGLPVGLMMVGEHFDDATVLTSAHTFEQTVETDLGE